MADEPTSLRRAARYLTGVGLVAQALGFLYRVALSRMAGAQVLGLYQLLLPVYSILLSVCVTGLAVGISTLTAEYEAKGEAHAARTLLLLGLGRLALLWLPLSAAVVLFQAPLSRLLGDGRTRLGLLLLLPVLLLTGVENLTKHHFYGLGEYRLPGSVELAEQAVRTAAILTLVWVFLPRKPEHTVALIVLGLLCSEVCSALLLMMAFFRRGGKNRPSQAAVKPLSLYRRLCRVSMPVSFTALLVDLMGCANAILLPRKLAALMPKARAMSAFGVLCGMTLPLLRLPFAFVSALCLALVPRLSRAYARGDLPLCRSLIRDALGGVSKVILPVYALLLTLGPGLGELLFHEGSVGAHLLPLSVGVLLSGYEGVLAACLNAVGRQRISALVSLLCGAVQLLCTLAGPGLSGFLVGAILSPALGAALRLLLVRHQFKLVLSPFPLFCSPMLGALLAGLAVRVLYQALDHLLTPFPLVLSACIAVGGFLYMTALSMLTTPADGSSDCPTARHSESAADSPGCPR